MWTTPSDREQAERTERKARDEREQARTATMTVEDRIQRWREEPRGEETEGEVDLLCEAEEELRRLRAQLVPAQVAP